MIKSQEGHISAPHIRDIFSKKREIMPSVTATCRRIAVSLERSRLFPKPKSPEKVANFMNTSIADFEKKMPSTAVYKMDEDAESDGAELFICDKGDHNRELILHPTNGSYSFGGVKKVSSCVCFSSHLLDPVEPSDDEADVSITKIDEPKVMIDFIDPRGVEKITSQIMTMHRRLLEECKDGLFPVLPTVIHIPDGGLRLIQTKYSSTLDKAFEDDSFVSAKDRELVSLSPENYKNILLTVLNTLISMHRRGLVHADVKPENIFVEQVGAETVGILFDFDTTGDIAKTSVIGTNVYSDTLFFEHGYRTPLTDAYAFARVAAKVFFKEVLLNEKKDYLDNDKYNEALHFARCNFLIKVMEANNDSSKVKFVAGIKGMNPLAKEEFISNRFVKRAIAGNADFYLDMVKYVDIVGQMMVEIAAFDGGIEASLKSNEIPELVISKANAFAGIFLERYSAILQN